MNKPDIDWQVVGQTIAVAHEKKENKPDGDGWFTSKQYVKELDVNRTTARHRLKKCVDQGLMEKHWDGRQNWYRVC